MFRKPKRKAKTSLRRKEDDEDDAVNRSSVKNDSDDEDEDTSALLSEARKRSKTTSTTVSGKSSGEDDSGRNVMHSFKPTDERISASELATSVAEHHPEQNATASKRDGESADAALVGRGEDGIFRNQQRNKFLAGPIRAAQHVRVTARFDYQPDICKDYKETGFCGFGDTCIYLHDRGDTLSGWQLEQQWEEQRKKEKERQEQEMQDFLEKSQGGGDDKKNSAMTSTEDGLPFACFLCRDYFKDPVVTNCQHYFCEKCIMQHVRSNSDGGERNSVTAAAPCPVCGKDTSSVFNQPTKLIAKKRKVVGSKASWEEYANSFREK